jgi:hypothetical protein
LPPPGTMARVEISEAHDYDLVGRATEIVSKGAANLHNTRVSATPQPFSILA